MATIKVKPWGEGQGDFVIIDEENFDKDFHRLYTDTNDEPKLKETKKPKEK